MLGSETVSWQIAADTTTNIVLIVGIVRAIGGDPTILLLDHRSTCRTAHTGPMIHPGGFRAVAGYGEAAMNGSSTASEAYLILAVFWADSPSAGWQR